MKAINFVMKAWKAPVKEVMQENARLETRVLSALQEKDVFSKERAHRAFAGLKKRAR